MRDPARIKDFCDRLAAIWESNCPDWRFGQLFFNVVGNDPIPIFFKEDDKMIQLFEEHFATPTNKVN